MPMAAAPSQLRLKSGSHFEKSSIDIAYKSATSLLSLLGMIEKADHAPAGPVGRYDIFAVVTKDFEDFRYAGEVKNFGHVKKNEVFAFQNGRPMIAAEDMYL